MRKLLNAILASLACVAATPARAEQQLWAAAYVDWSFEAEDVGVELSQLLWAPQPAVASFFTLNWDFEAGDGGYIGLQSNEVGAGNVRFSLWNADAARGEACRRFDGEGEGMTCVLPLTIARDQLYRVGIARGQSDAQGQWWIGWVEDASGRRQQIGALRVSASLNAIAPASIHNFSEYWGDAVSACSSVPLSAAAFAAPAINSASGPSAIAAHPIGRRPDGHSCTSGRERTGAVAGHTPLSIAGEPAMLLTLGGPHDANQALAQHLRTRAPAQ